MLEFCQWWKSTATLIVCMTSVSCHSCDSWHFSTTRGQIICISWLAGVFRFHLTMFVSDYVGRCWILWIVGLLVCEYFCEARFIWQLSKHAESGLSNNVYLMWILIYSSVSSFQIPQALFYYQSARCFMGDHKRWILNIYRECISGNWAGVRPWNSVDTWWQSWAKSELMNTPSVGSGSS